MAELTSPEQSALASCESIIERGLKSFVEVGEALLKIRDEKLYRHGYNDWDHYCRARWGWERNYANKQIRAAEVIPNLGTNVPIPATEAVARPLTALPAPQQREAWSRAVAESPTGTPTAREVETVVKRDFMQVVHQPVNADVPKPPTYFMGNTWRQSDVMRLQEDLGELPEDERDKVAAVIGKAKLMDPQLASKMIRNMAAMKPQKRSEIYRLSESDDPRDVTLSLTNAAALPPSPDPRLGSLEMALDALKHAAEPYPNDPLTPEILALIESVKKVRAAVKLVSYDARRDGPKTAA